VTRRWLLHLRTAPAAAFGVVLLVFIATAILELTLRPIYEAPDEISHFHYAQIIANHAALPGAGFHERQQPPAYYLMSAALMKIGLGLEGPRLLSLVCGLTTLVLCGLVAREIWPGRPWLWVAATAIAAALPEMQYLSGAATNESLAWTVGAVLVLLCVRVVRSSRLTPRLVLWCAVVVGIAAITRQEDWVLAVLLVGVILWRGRGRLMGRTIAAAGCISVAIAGWWFVRNVLTFGSILPPETPLAAVGPHTLRSLGQLRTFLSQLIVGLSGTYGNGQDERHASLGGVALPFNVLSLLVVLVVSIGCVTLVASRWRAWTARTRALVGVLAAAPVLLLGAVLLNSIVVDLQPQTRYMFTALPALCVAVVAVSWHLVRIHPRRLLTVAVVGTAAAVGLAFDVAGIVTAASLPAFHGQAVPDNPRLSLGSSSGDA
jgi:hypothetical protein